MTIGVAAAPRNCAGDAVIVAELIKDPLEKDAMPFLAAIMLPLRPAVGTRERDARRRRREEEGERIVRAMVDESKLFVVLSSKY